MRLATANKELTTTCHFFCLVSHLKWSSSCSFYFSSSPTSLAVFWHSVLCRSHARFSCAFCTCSNSPSPGDHGTALVLSGWRGWWWGAGRSRQGWQHSLGRRNCWLCTCLGAAQRCHPRAVLREVPVSDQSLCGC